MAKKKRDPEINENAEVVNLVPDEKHEGGMDCMEPTTIGKTIPEETFFVEDDAPTGPEFHLVETVVKVGEKMLTISNTVDLGMVDEAEAEVSRMIELYGAQEVIDGFRKTAMGKVANLQRRAARKGDVEFAARIGAEWNSLVPKRGSKKIIDKDKVMRESLMEKGFTEEEINEFLAIKTG